MDWSLLWSATWRGVLLAIPTWIVYIMIKIKVLEWWEKRGVK